MFPIITRDIPGNPLLRNVFLPLFLLQIPQKTLARFNVTTADWGQLLALLLKVDTSDVGAAQAFIDFDGYNKVVTTGIRLFGADHFLASYIEDIQPHHFGPVGMAAVSAPTVGEGLEAWLSQATVMAPVCSVTRQISGDEIIVSFRQVIDIGELRHIYDEMIVLLTRKIIQLLAGPDTQVRVLFAHSPTNSPEYYEKHFDTAPKFNSKETCLILSREIMQRQNEGYSPLLYQQSREECARLREIARNYSQVSTRVRHILMEGSIASNFYSLDEVADRMHLSVRTLTRRLREESVSFRELQSEARLELAKTQLRESSLPVKVISANAGFSNLSAFSRAFRQYAGLPPSEYRDQAASGT